MPTGVLAGSLVVVTGGASGIGRALAERCAAEGARTVVVADIDQVAAAEVASGVTGAVAVGLDVTDPAAVVTTVRDITAAHGDIDVWCSNAGVAVGTGLADDAEWDTSWRLHVLAHVHAARHVLTGMVERGRGHFMITASAAGLLTGMESAPYTVTKHGSVALAEWLAIRYGGSGVHVSCLCPQAVRTPMTDGLDPGSATLAAGRLLEPAEVATAVVEAFADRRFLILPHPEVAEYERRRTGDRDRWLAGMRRSWQRQADAEPGG
jgi:NAD(P)-dependent dehydrogenase (short-subunit alcohol dehydrogenase family)